MTMRVFGCMLAALLAGATLASAAGVGEAHLTAPSPTAALRDANHRGEVRITVWYPAAADAIETRRTIGLPGKPVFEGGSASDDAPVAEAPAAWPIVLLSHGFGGSARMMSWFGTELARDGAVVVAVDHPGNSALDPLTIPGAVLWWDRADDLRIAWQAVRADARFARRIDPSRLGVAGFSAGGFTALVAAGVRIDLAHFDRFCLEHPDDGVCRPQTEMQGASGRNRQAAFARPELKDAGARAADDHAIPGIKAIFLMAPALIQALQPESLRALATPVGIVLGSTDDVAPPKTNGDVVADASHAELRRLDAVGHYDFLSTCTAFGQAVIPFCTFAVPQETTHRRALDQARALFAPILSR